MRLGFLPFLFLVVPVAEIAVFVFVGGRIGILPTIGLVLLTAIAGSFLLRVQGLGVLAKIQREAAAGRIPGKELGHGAMLLLAGLLLMTPGFITDTLGLLLFVPAIREIVWRFVASRLTLMPAGFAGPRGWQGDDAGKVFDLDPGEFEQREAPRTGPEPRKIG